jgi:CRP/FNR family transcriptional regulator
MMHVVSYPAGSVLFSEKDMPELVYVVLEGEVKLSINSSEGKRLILRIAKKGEIVGIASALSGNSYDMTAETQYASKLAPIGRRDFLNFLLRHPDAYQTLTEELSRQYTMACDQLRSVVLSTSAPEKLARLLLDWSENGQRTEFGMRFRFSLTHGEIGEFIGASRDFVPRVNAHDSQSHGFGTVCSALRQHYWLRAARGSGSAVRSRILASRSAG